MNISKSIAQIFPLANVKGHKAIVAQIGTNSNTSYSAHVNGIEFTEFSWDKRLHNDYYKCLPKPVKKIIGFANAHGYHDKQSAFLAEKQQNGNNKKRGVSQFCTMDLPTMTQKGNGGTCCQQDCTTFHQG